MKLSHLHLFLIIIICASCFRPDHKISYNKKSIELNDRAIDLISNYRYDSALILLDQAINIDSRYYIAYGNKINIFIKLKDFKQAISESNRLLSIKPDLAEGWQFEGIIYDFMGDSVNAKKYYYKSIELFDNRISDSKNEKYIYNNKLNRATSLLLARQEEAAHDSLRKLIDQYPDEKMTYTFIKLNRKDLLNQIMDNK